MLIIPSLFYDFYIGIRPLDWLIILHLSLKLRNVTVDWKYIFLYAAMWILAFLFNNVIFLTFGLICLLLLHSYYWNRPYLRDLNLAIWAFVIAFYVDFFVAQIFALDLKNIIGLKNENYEADYTRYSGILSEASNVGTVVFMLAFPYISHKRVCNFTMLKYIVWVIPGFISFSITSQIFSLLWFSYALILWLLESRTAKYIMPLLIGCVLFVTVNSFDVLDRRYLERLDVFTNLVTEQNFENLADGSMKDRYGGSLSGGDFAGPLQVFGTSAPSGYRSIFGILFQSLNYSSILLLSAVTILLQFTVGFRSVFWFCCCLLMPSQFLTTILLYISMYGVFMKVRHHQNISKSTLSQQSEAPGAK